MSIKLSKKTSIIVAIILFVVVGGTGGYLLWKVNNPDTIGPTDSDASGCTSTCDPGSTKRDAGEYGKVNCNEDEKGYELNGHLWCCKPYTVTCPTSCGDGTCNGSETATSCPSDCACKAYTWSFKPSGSYKPADFTRTTTITNPNSTSGTADKVNITLNSTALSACGTTTGVSCYTVSTSGGKQQVSVNMVGGVQYLSVGSYSLSVTLPGPVTTCNESATFAIASTCGDNICSSDETETSCAADCSVCKGLIWANEPAGTYKTTDTLKNVSIVNSNSTTTSMTGTTIKLNNTALKSCSDSTDSCYDVSVNSAGLQLLTVKLFPNVSALPVGNYTLTISSLGTDGTKACTGTASFTVSDGSVPQTGLLDGTVGKLSLGMGFVFLGIVTTQIPKFKYTLNILGEKNREVAEIKRKEKEEKRRNRFERRFE